MPDLRVLGHCSREGTQASISQCAKEHAGEFFWVVVVGGGGRTQGLIYLQAVLELTMKPRMTLSF